MPKSQGMSPLQAHGGSVQPEGHIPAPSHDAGMWSVRVGRQGMTCAVWKQLLDVVTPTAIVLAAPVSFQAGLIWAFLEYNDKRSMLG